MWQGVSAGQAIR